MSQIFQLPKPLSISDNLTLMGGAKAYFFQTGTDTPQDTYSDYNLATPHANPVVADSAGRFAPIWLDSSLSRYKLVLKTSADVTVYTVDPVNQFILTQAELAKLLFPRTQAEISAGVTPTDYSYLPGDARRYGVAAGSSDQTAQVQNALNCGEKVVEFLGLSVKCDAVTVPAGVWAKNLNLTKFTNAAGNIVLVNTGCKVTGKVGGTSLITGSNIVQRCIYPAADGVTDVELDVEVYNATYGVHAQYLGTADEANWPRRWHGYIYAHDIVGTGGEDEGYGVLLSPARDCNLTVNAKAIARHAVYLSAGARGNDILTTIDGCANYAVQLYSTSVQSATQYNTVRIKARNLTEATAGQSGALAIVQKANYNRIIIEQEGDGNTSYAAKVEGASGGPYPLGNEIVHGKITGEFTGTDVIQLLNADSTIVAQNTLHCFATNDVIGLRRSGTNGITHGGHVYDNDVDGQGQNVVGVYDEVNTVASYIGQNRIRNNGSSLRVNDQTSGKRTGYSRRATFAGTSGTVTAGATLDVTPTLSQAIQTAARGTSARLVGASVNYTTPSVILGQAGADETHAAIRIYNAHVVNQTFDYEGFVEGD